MEARDFLSYSTVEKNQTELIKINFKLFHLPIKTQLYEITSFENSRTNPFEKHK